MSHWMQTRPDWCPYKDCRFKRRAQNAMCCGHLPKPVPHDVDFNIYRLCLNKMGKDGGVFDLQINKTDIYYFRKMFISLMEDTR